MNYIGIDVSSKKLNIHITGESPADYEIANTKKSIIDFIKANKINLSDYVVGAESTARYHLRCQEAFVEKGFEFRLINPILTGKKIASSIRKKKTDRSDAKIISQLLIQGEGRVITVEQLDISRRSVLRTRKTLVNHRTSLKIVLQELKREKSNVQVKTAIHTLEKLIKEMDKSVKALEKSALVKGTETEAEKLIKTIPGFAAQLSAIVATEVGDFSRFPSKTQFKAYVGIDSKVTQSGNSLKTGRITKRGNKHLREAFYLAAQVSRCHDPELIAFYQKKISEGKPVRVAICAVARKLCERVFAVVTKGVPYEIRQPSFT